MSAAFFEQAWPRGNRRLRALRDGWTSTLAGKRRKRRKDLRGGIEGRDGFLPICPYIFSGLASAQSGLSSIRMRGKTIATLASWRVWPFAIGITHASKLSQNYHSTLATLEQGTSLRGKRQICRTDDARSRSSGRRPHNATTRRALGKGAPNIRSPGPKYWGPISSKFIRGKTWRDLSLAGPLKSWVDTVDTVDTRG
jgi:hypothetical protein